MDKPLVSVVIPIYNVEEYLEECFNSVVSQTYKNLEIVLVNDGSTDTSGLLADTLAENDSRASVIHKENGGLSDARNTGIKIANGEYITFIDSDDYVGLSYIEEMMKVVTTFSSDIVQVDNSRDPSKLGGGSKKHTVMSGKSAFSKLMKFKTISPTAWGKLYKTSIFSENNLKFPVGRLHEDTAVLYKLVYFADNVSCIDSVQYYYRINQNSIMTASYTKKHYESVVKYHEELDIFIKTHRLDLDSKTISKHKALRLLSVLNKLALNGEHHSKTYGVFKEQYVALIGRTNSVVCLIGIIPVTYPVIFRGSRAMLPKVRAMMGKV